MSAAQTYRFSGETRRLDQFLSSKLAPLSRTRVQKLIAGGAVMVNGSPAPLSRRLLEPGDEVSVRIPDFTSLPASSAEDVPILFEDAHLIVVDKPAGWVVHPAGPHREGTLIQRLWPKLAKNWARAAPKPGRSKKESVPAADRPGVVHRLDRGTSGVIVIAKTPAAADALSRQFADRVAKKTYWAVVWGAPLNPKGHIRSVVGRSRAEPHKMSVTDQGRWSETEFKVLERYPKFRGRGCALLEVTPLTGRTHQIRVQLAALGHPVVGDAVYGEKELPAADRPLLHALRLELTHPGTRKRVAWRAEPPADLRKFLAEARA
jgi:23S rRNA pseudouridine1911/1915/1917 synthase